ncbi:hypothetical protein [Telluribacter sp. SYSU D00476]|uniref:hypothetical protein n=1 Tax=Telluribacter sp. SYSU D00476 TaxID=2811430 RepID=UPI001FF5BE72|nr:hypothetical protein [Telluribacter sp. SYSU D00476]
MRYLTANGTILSGYSPWDILEELKNSSPSDAHLPMDPFLEDLMMRIQWFFDKEIKRCCHHQLLKHMEEAGLLLRIE